tara:strand:- start:5604 stop:8498 length:2895 start_codon:yes stop_codon:yes gene_type:complete
VYKKLFFSIFLCAGIAGDISAQWNSYDGLPLTKSFLSTDYNGYVQNWGFAQDSNKVMYVANLGQVLFFDGDKWDKIFIENQRAYSIKSDQNGKVYVGGQNEFGYLDSPVNDSTTNKQYFSLKGLIGDSINFGIIWKIFTHKDAVYFMSSKYLFMMKENQIFTFKTENSFQNVLEINGEPLVNIVSNGLYYIHNAGLDKYADNEFFLKESLASWVKSKETYFFCGNRCAKFKNGEFYAFKTEADEYLKKYRAYDMLSLSDGTLLLGTLGGGIVHLSENGALIKIYDQSTVLTNNQVLDLYQDLNGKVWVATYNGISVLEFDVPIREFGKFDGVEGMVRSIYVSNNNMLIGSNEGFSVYNYTDKQFSKRNDISTPCKNLTPFESSVLMICDYYLYELKNEDFNQLSKTPYDEFLISENNKRLVYAIKSERLGIDILSLVQNKVKLLYQISNRNETIASIAEDGEGNVWFGTTSNGVMQVTLKKSKASIISHSILNHTLPDDGFDKSVRVGQLNNEAAFFTSSGLFRYDSENKIFKPENRYGEFFAGGSGNQVFMAAEDQFNDVWFRSNQAFVEAKKDSSHKYKIERGYLNRIEASQVNDLKIDKKGFLWIATGEGLIRFNTKKNKGYEDNFHVQIDRVLVRNDSLINGGTKKNQILPYKDNELRFTYSAISYEDPSKNNFQIKLEGFDDNWSNWTSEKQKDYTNIPEGTYTFRVKAKNVYGIEQDAAGFPFTILPPWYRTWWAYLAYVLFFGALLYLMYKIRINQILKVQRIRNRIADDLHDDLSGTLIGISNFAKAINSNPDVDIQNRFLGLIQKSADEAKEKISDIVWTINPEHDDWTTFLAKCRRHASDIFESQNIEFSLEMDENIPDELGMELRKNLWLIFKEIITNIIKHSAANYVLIRFKTTNKKISILIKDNGKGFDLDSAEKGNGIESIKKRVYALRGEVELVSNVDQGTFWKIQIPL